MSLLRRGRSYGPARWPFTARSRADGVRHVGPGWAGGAYGVFLPKHRNGNPGGPTPSFSQHRDASFSLIN